MDTWEWLLMFLVGIFIATGLVGAGFLAGRELFNGNDNMTIVAEVSDGGFVIKDSLGENHIVHWEDVDNE